MAGFGKDGKGQILWENGINDGNIGALATKDVVEFGGSYHEALEEDFRMLKCEYWMGIAPAQAITVADGPILVGFASGSLQAAEIEECLESVPINHSDILLEKAMRPVWPLETFVIQDPDTGNAGDLHRKGSFNPKWTFANPDGWTWWIYNLSTATLTTSNLLSISAKFFGVWIT